jgi:hypothetical protein
MRSWSLASSNPSSECRRQPIKVGEDGDERTPGGEVPPGQDRAKQQKEVLTWKVF